MGKNQYVHETIRTMKHYHPAESGGLFYNCDWILENGSKSYIHVIHCIFLRVFKMICSYACSYYLHNIFEHFSYELHILLIMNHNSGS